MIVTRCVVLLALLCPVTSGAQQPPADSARVAMERAAWRDLERLETAERALLRSANRAPDRASARHQSLAARRDSLLEPLRARLDTIIAAPWGDSVLADLRAAWPGSALLQEYAAHRAEAVGRDADAVTLYGVVLRDRPDDAGVLRARGAALQRLGRDAEATRDLSLAFELDPDNADGWRALLALRQARGDLDALLAQVRRIELRLPRSVALRDHEVEVLQRLGRLDAAQAAAGRELRP